jgi:hypothetical protein
MSHFSSGYLFQTPPNPGPFFTAFTVALVVLFLICAFAYWRRGRLARNNPVLRRLIRRAAQVGMWTSAIAILLALTRYAQIPYLSMPIVLYLSLLLIVGVVAYFVYELSERYPLAVWKLQESHIERRYRPATKPRSEPQRARPKERGKRRR